MLLQICRYFCIFIILFVDEIYVVELFSRQLRMDPGDLTRSAIKLSMNKYYRCIFDEYIWTEIFFSNLITQMFRNHKRKRPFSYNCDIFCLLRSLAFDCHERRIWASEYHLDMEVFDRGDCSGLINAPRIDVAGLGEGRGNEARRRQKFGPGSGADFKESPHTRQRQSPTGAKGRKGPR